jgi:hypothetical protein
MRTFPTFEAALEAASDQESVCGTYREPDSEEGFGTPVYFLAPASAGKELMGSLSYEARTGKPHPDPAYLSWLTNEARSL